MADAIAEKRLAGDRRQLSWRTVVYGFTRSRRHRARRAADAEFVFIDWHHPWLFFLAVGTMLLSVTDAFLTLRLLDRGMIEANPVMNAMMNHSTGVFVTSKMVLTGVSILLLVFLAKFRFLNRFRTGLLLTMFFSFYCCLICYEIVNLLRLA